MTELDPTIPPIDDLHPEAIRYLAKVFHTVDLTVKTPELAEWSSQLFIALEHRLNLDDDDYASGSRVPPVSTLPTDSLLYLQRVIGRAITVADDFGIGLDGDALIWLSSLLAYVDHELEDRQPAPLPPPTKAERAEGMINQAYDNMFAAEDLARARASRPPSDLSGIPPWSEVSGAAG